MATTTSNFSWPIPQSTDLVKDGATAIASLGSGIDTSMVDLKGGTTGQILSKASGTDMDFTWINNDQGDITGVTAGTGLTGGGTSGSVTLDFDIANYGGGQYAAGKNKIINGDFAINQRNTFTYTNPAGYVMADRWVFSNYVSGTNVCSMQSFTAGTAPVTGYEAQYFARFANSGQSSASQDSILIQKIEDVRTFANQTITVSFWAKCDVSSKKVAVEMVQNFGSGGSPSASVNTYFGQVTLTTSWARYSVTGTVPSISGKTIGTTANTSSLQLFLWNSAGSDYNSRTGSIGIQNNTFDFWGVQVEAGSTATPFQTATGTKQGELAACQRYYWRANWDGSSNYVFGGNGGGNSSTQARTNVWFPVMMRTKPTSLDYATISKYAIFTYADAQVTPTAVSLDSNLSNSNQGYLLWTAASGLTANALYYVRGNNDSTAYLGFSAEL